jgi:putative hydrolase of the HAD superfamily
MPFTKPHPSAFQTVLDGLGVSDPAKAVFVGDRRYDDVWGSQSFGMRGVWVRSPHTPPWEVEPDAVIDSLDELVPLIDKWAGQ